MKKRFALLLIILFGVSMSLPADAGWRPKPEKKQEIISNAKTALSKFKKSDPGLKRFFQKSYGYAIYPTVGKGGIGIGGAYGEGVVYEKGRIVGHTSLTQLSIGLQWGGQAYSELIFFKDKKAFDKFKGGKFQLGAGVSAVAITLGASADAEFSNGVAVFTQAKGGLMYEASVSGQKLKYWDYD